MKDGGWMINVKGWRMKDERWRMKDEGWRFWAVRGFDLWQTDGWIFVIVESFLQLIMRVSWSDKLYVKYYFFRIYKNTQRLVDCERI